ncbi:response regulator [Bacteriovorax sp. DB6_IX]|uniref:PAS domain-containing hybrid sensor histidine kinase/response regulator n=1 Tax=Bacteriovorax sp. DB6_IX TaxID=1353530 RepID=UPI00055902A0|nr:response regulator [Bacteriovorax sp. DB6_IX]
MKRFLTLLTCGVIISIELIIFLAFGSSDALTIALLISVTSSMGIHYFMRQNLIKDVELEEAILKSAKVSIIATDTDGIITHFSKGAEDLLGYSAREMVGKQNPSIIHDIEEIVERTKELNEEFGENNPPGFLTFVRKVYRDDKDEREWTYIKKDGTRFPVILSVTPIYDSKKIIVGFLGVATDLSDIKKQRDMLFKAKEEAMLANRSKSFFLANMSHELRTPLNGIIGMSEILSNTDLDNDQKKTNQYIMESSLQLSSIISDILDYTKIEMGGMSINPAPTLMESFNQKVQHLLETHNQNSKVRSEFVTNGVIPEYLMLDRTRMIQVLTNLISNAFKFTREGIVTVKCTYVDGNLIYKVEDTGIGIEESKVAHIFAAFTQETEHMKREFFGTGLGLSIVRELIQLMGGGVSVESTKDIGSQFLISVPAVETTSEVTFDSDFHEVNLKDLEILLVEDNTINQKLVVKTLESAGAKVSIAKNGVEAVDMTRDKDFSLILMDYQLPVMDGITATKKIREFKPDIPIIALTANAFEEDKRECLLAGMNDFLTKPISPKKLKWAIHKIL